MWRVRAARGGKAEVRTEVRLVSESPMGNAEKREFKQLRGVERFIDGIEKQRLGRVIPATVSLSLGSRHV
jgi:hypothetical protein